MCIIYLLQGWILEHLPGSYPRQPNKRWKPDRPCAGRWLTSRGHTTVHHYRLLLDRLEVDDVRWHTYEDHREIRPFQLIVTYSGWLICGKERVYRHLPERVKRQFAFVQDVPRHRPIVLKMPREMLTTVLIDPVPWYYPDWVHRC